MVDPPSDTGAVHVTTDSRVAPALAVTEVGAPGLLGGVAVATEEEAAEATEIPTPLVAVTVNVYDVASSKPVTVQLVVALVHVWPPFEVTV